MKFTDEQQQVIDARNCNILVSAAAGSGKTAVLVERIIQLISGDDPIDIDKLLVVTFTKAAATQMKERITEAISNKLLEDPDNKHLQRQETLIHNAQITTIDSFCQYVLRNNFNDIGLDPGYRVADEGEGKLLQQDVMAELLEQEYEKGDEDFLFLMDYFATGSNDTAVEQYIMQLYKFAMSMPWPKDWIMERSRDYDTAETDFDEMDFVKLCVSQAKDLIGDCVDRYKNGIALSNAPDGPYFYGDLFEKEMHTLVNCMHKDTFSDLQAALDAVTYDRLPSKKDPAVNPDKRERAKDIRDDIKKQIAALKKESFGLSKERILEQMQLCDRAMKELSRLTIRFIEEFDAAKRKAGVIDFNDMEHFALNILVHHESRTEESPEINEPTAAALEYRSFFKEVLIDEYQDSNNVQELLLSVISGDQPGTYDRFMVGDVKQSIYKFRLARPEIFMEKLDTYSKEKTASLRRIDLHMNFRSRSEVLDSTNYIFRQAMARDLGGVAYDSDAMLVTGADYYPTPEKKGIFNTEMYIIKTDKDEDEQDTEENAMPAALEPSKKLSGKQQEALVIARNIKKLMAEGQVSAKDGTFRNVKYSDIVILLRTASGWDDEFKKILEAEGIPAYVESRTGYFAATEVVTVLQLFAVLDNTLQDIPLVSVMHSYIGGFSDEELAIIKAADRENHGDKFYYSLVRFAEGEGDLALKEKVKAFLNMLTDFRSKTVYMPVHELLEYIFDKTGLREYVAALPGGSQRKANLDMLLQRASDFERTNFKGVFHFVRYIEQLRQYEVDYGEANILDEHADVVRIMSIHKSKGLEFPIVYLAGLAKKFNTRDLSGDLIVDVDMGVGVSCIDSVNRVKFTTLRQQVLKHKMKHDSLGEELRILYVAMTRAKEKLIMTAAVKNPESGIEKALSGLRAMDFSSDALQPEALPYTYRSGFENYYKIVMPSLLRHPCAKGLLEQLHMDTDLVKGIADTRDNLPAFDIHVISADDLKAEAVMDETALAVRKTRLEMPVTEEDIDKELDAELEEKFSFKYSHENLGSLYTKTTVTELKKALLEEQNEGSAHMFEKESEEKAYVPSFIQEKAPLTGAVRGTAYHRVMELLDGEMYGILEKLNDDYTTDDILNNVKEWMKKKADTGFMPEEYVDAVNPEDVIKFLKSDLGRRMASAHADNRLFCEKPFMMGIPANKVHEEFPDSEMLLIQGIIDAWFLEGDDIILMDYKTDHVRAGAELIDRYHIQLDYYQEALESITGKKVKEKWIYSFTLASDIRL